MVSGPPRCSRGPPRPGRHAHAPAHDQHAQSRAAPTHAQALPAAATPNASRGFSHSLSPPAIFSAAATNSLWPPHLLPHARCIRCISRAARRAETELLHARSEHTPAPHSTQPTAHSNPHTADTPATAASAFTLSRALSHAPCTHTAGHARHRPHATRKQASKHAPHAPRTQRTPHNTGTAPSTAHTYLTTLSQPLPR